MRKLHFSKRPGDILPFPRFDWKGRKHWHPTPKPLPLIEQLLGYSIGGMEKARVLDPFAGSGSVGVICKSLRTHCTLIELDRDYCEKIAERLQRVGTDAYYKKNLPTPKAIELFKTTPALTLKREENRHRRDDELALILTNIKQELQAL